MFLIGKGKQIMMVFPFLCETEDLFAPRPVDLLFTEFGFRGNDAARLRFHEFVDNAQGRYIARGDKVSAYTEGINRRAAGEESFDLVFVQVATRDNPGFMPSVAVEDSTNFAALLQQVAAVKPHSQDVFSQRRRDFRSCQRVISINQEDPRVREGFQQSLEAAAFTGENLRP